ncbi:septum formation initiator family protein [uncultured Arcanobacterium sp.]|uniref:FtsB family cell division protein n=1 Tax=uncultured Arcanobacterium sp. TaxID=487520 RepID=UPI00263689BE|nr:septum formation initiator family protein [uncultured Arcanobacterium sp.]
MASRRPYSRSASSGKQRSVSRRGVRADVPAPKKPGNAKVGKVKKAVPPRRPPKAGEVHSGNSSQPGLTQRLGNDWNVVLKGEGKTRQFSLRLAFIVITVMLSLVIVANPLRTFISLQEEKRTLAATLQEHTEREKELRNEIALWKNPLFVQAQARERIGYVLPGQTLYVVEQKKAQDGETAAAERIEKMRKERLAVTPFYLTMWESLQLAGGVAKNDADSDEKTTDLEDTPILKMPEGNTSEGQTSEGKTG